MGSEQPQIAVVITQLLPLQSALEVHGVCTLQKPGPVPQLGPVPLVQQLLWQSESWVQAPQMGMLPLPLVVLLLAAPELLEVPGLELVVVELTTEVLELLVV